MKFERVLELTIGGISCPRLILFEYEIDEFPRLDGRPRIDIYGAHVLRNQNWMPCSHLWDILSDTQQEWIEKRMTETWDGKDYTAIEKETA